MYRLHRNCYLVLLLCFVLLVACQPVSLAQLQREGDIALRTADLDFDPNVPMPAAEAHSPVALQIEELGLTVDVAPMGWAVTESNNQPTTEWIIPTDAAGWHVNSAGAGAVGNLILSGHQITGDAVFAPLALGDITVGQEIVITDEMGQTFLYRVAEVSEPVPILGATEVDDEMARSFLNPSDVPLLTLMTGWPEFTTTHRIFAVAEFVERIS